MVVFLQIMNCVTIKLIRPQVRQGQLRLGDVGVFDLGRKVCASLNLYKYVLLGHSISSSAIPCSSRQVSPIGVKEIPGRSPSSTDNKKNARVLPVNNQRFGEYSHYSPRNPLLKPIYRKVLVDFRTV